MAIGDPRARVRAARPGHAVAACIASAVLLAGGCGLLADVDPPDPPGIDAGSRDGGRLDGRIAVDGSVGPEGGPRCRSSAECDDSSPCNGIELCLDGACTPGEAPDCGDAIDCTIDECAPATGACVHIADDTLCDDDGLACTLERCSEVAGCVPELRHDLCDDSVFCTHDECDPEATATSGCEHAPLDDRCGLASCDPTLGCVGIECEVAGDCTLGPCHSAATCVENRCMRTNRDDGTACDDGSPCTASSACVSGECRGITDPTCPGQPCVRCDPTGGCDGSVVVPRGTSCDDGSACTGPDACDGAICGGPLPDCGDRNQCTADHCDPAIGCVHGPMVGMTCDDGDACVDDTTCQSDGQCGGGSPHCPTPGTNPCRTVTCSATGACLVADIDGAPCPTGTCVGGACVAGVCPVDTARCLDDTCCPLRSGICNPTTGGCDLCNPDEFLCPCEAACYPRTCRGNPGCCDTCAPTACALLGVTCRADQACCECDGTCYDPACLSCCMC